MCLNIYNDSELTLVHNYLAIEFHASPSFNELCLCIQNNAYSMPGFINRSCKSFNHPKSLNCTYVDGQFWTTTL